MMMTVSLERKFLWSLCGLVALTGGSSLVTRASAAPASPGDVPPSALAPADSRIVKRLHAIHQLEISAGQMAEANGGAQAVRDFGATIVSDHQAADQSLLAYATKAGVDADKLPPDLAKVMAGETAQIERVRKLSGQSFDREFTRGIRDADGRVLTVVQTAVPDVGDPSLRKLLHGLLPTLRAEYETAARLAASPAAAVLSPQAPKPTSTGQ